MTYRRGRIDVTLNGQLFLLAGDTVAAARSGAAGTDGAYLLGPPGLDDASQWLDLTARTWMGDRAELIARLDRASIGYTGDRLVVRLGRQALSWGNGLVFQVLDLFNPFPPNVLDTDYKPGRDMLTTQWRLPWGDLQAIVVPGERVDHHAAVLGVMKQDDGLRTPGLTIGRKQNAHFSQQCVRRRQRVGSGARRACGGALAAPGADIRVDCDMIAVGRNRAGRAEIETAPAADDLRPRMRAQVFREIDIAWLVECAGQVARFEHCPKDGGRIAGIRAQITVAQVGSGE